MLEIERHPEENSSDSELEDFNRNLSEINSSDTRVRRKNTLTSKISEVSTKSEMDFELNFKMSQFQIRVESKKNGTCVLFEMLQLKTQVYLERNF